MTNDIATSTAAIATRRRPMNLAKCGCDISSTRARVRSLRPSTGCSTCYFGEMSSAQGWYSYHVLTFEYRYFELRATANSWYHSGT